MKKILIFVCLISVSCSSNLGENKNNPKDINDQTKTHNYQKDCKFKEIFKIHINDIKETKVSNVAKVFNFPIQDANIWYAVYFSSGIESYDTKTPFTYVSLKENFKRLFSIEFLKTLNNLDLNELFSQGEFQTKTFTYTEDDIQTSYKLKSIYDKNLNTIELSLNYDFFEENVNYESRISFNYEFLDCKLRLKRILVAG